MEIIQDEILSSEEIKKRYSNEYERSIGKTIKEELAVMIDIFHLLQVTEAALKIDYASIISRG